MTSIEGSRLMESEAAQESGRILEDVDKRQSLEKAGWCRGDVFKQGSMDASKPSSFQIPSWQ